MAELKYDLKLVNTVTDKTIKFQPWYKERIRTRMIKSLKPTDTSKVLVPSKWTFVKDGLDDFRDGLPPAGGEDVRLKPGENIGPLLTGPNSHRPISQIKQSASRGRFDKDDVCFSRKTPSQRSREEKIDNIEFELLQHPLALYPHLEESLPPDVFEDVVDVLDPAMNDIQEEETEAEDDDDEGSQGEGGDAFPGDSGMRGTPSGRRSVQFRHSSMSQQSEDNDRDDPKTPVLNPFKWLPKRDEKERREQAAARRRSQEARGDSPSQDRRIQEVAHDFCSWVSGLGGETNNIEESTIYSLFASGYETKPALSVPIHVVELSNVPHELRMSAATPSGLEGGSAPGSASGQRGQGAKVGRRGNDEGGQDDWKYSKSSYKPSWNKKEYGSWYLPTKLWNSRGKGEPLVDPQAIKNMEESEVKKNSDALNADLAPLHGSKAFIEYIEKKNTRKPEFLEQISKIHQKMEEDENQKKLDAEAKARVKQRDVR